MNRVFRSGVAALVLTGAGILMSTAAWAGDITGYWRTPVPHHRDSVVQIYKSGDVYDGKIVALEEPTYTKAENAKLAGKPKLDLNNPEKARRDRPLMDLVLLHGLKPDGENHWHDGKIYDPVSGHTYDAQAALSKDGKTLHLRGYLMISIFGRTQNWKRVDGPDVFGNQPAAAAARPAPTATTH